jgi:hypothetical protein
MRVSLNSLGTLGPEGGKRVMWNRRTDLVLDRSVLTSAFLTQARADCGD